MGTQELSNDDKTSYGKYLWVDVHIPMALYASTNIDDQQTTTEFQPCHTHSAGF